MFVMVHDWENKTKSLGESDFSRISDRDLALKSRSYVVNDVGPGFEDSSGLIGIALAGEIDKRRGEKTVSRWMRESEMGKTEFCDYKFQEVMNARGLNPSMSKLSSLRNIIREVYDYECLWAGSDFTEKGREGYKKYLEEIDPDNLRKFVGRRYENGVRISKNLAKGLDKDGKR